MFHRFHTFDLLYIAEKYHGKTFFTMFYKDFGKYQ